MDVQVYFNLHKKVFSIRSTKSGKVIGYSEDVLLRDCRYRVQPAGRERVLREGKKNVHAYIGGTLVCTDKITLPGGGVKVYYNPYKTNSFCVVGTEERVDSSESAYITTSRGVIAYDINE